MEQIAVCESRQQYVRDALAESEKIAREVTRNAELRVDKIMANAQWAIMPQQEHIARLEKEIKELTEEIQSRSMNTPEPKPELADMPYSFREFSLREPQYINLSIDNPHDGSNSVPAWQPESSREFSLREPPDEDIAKIKAANPPEQDQDDSQPIIRREFSLREPPEEDITEIKTTNPPEQDQPDDKPMARREFSLRVPQNLDIPVDEFWPPQNESADERQLNLTEYNLPEPQDEEISNYNLAMSLIEQNESDMHLDVFVDLRYVVAADEKDGKMQRHSWQVKILVEVPADSQKIVGYGKASSAVTSTLLRFDDVVLNDVYPFGIIAPNPENIAMYFFNCLQDTVALMDLNLKEITIWENQARVMEVRQRNTAFDEQLQQGDDILHDIRSLLTARDRGEDKNNSKNRLGNLFKNI
ncbi:MAG: 6-carboxytetrahydropterin synthase [Syntrophomonadaceae bacterium]|nr:6-carboxytetrahydropterin synthase [Syntrophomonadaceae bacterium]